MTEPTKIKVKPFDKHNEEFVEIYEFMFNPEVHELYVPPEPEPEGDPE